MKKIYQAPELLVVDVRTVSLIMQSMGSSTTNEGNFDMGGVKEGSAEIEFTREDKGWDIWGDDYNE